MKVFKAVSVELENKGQFLGTSKRVQCVDGKFQPTYETKEEFINRMKTTQIWSFELIEC